MGKYKRGASELQDRGAGPRKERQLCREAFEAIGLALATLEDPAWADVTLIDVEPAPDASRLAVVVSAGDGVEPQALLDKLERIGGYLRSELAAAIQRKRVPALTFRIASSDCEHEHEHEHEEEAR
jgi:ribosome-binding factor A